MEQRTGEPGSTRNGRAQSSTTILYCGTCGRRWDDSQYCPGCGALRPPQPTVPQPTAPELLPHTMVTPVALAGTAEAHRPAVNTEPPARPARFSSRARLTAVAAAVLVVVMIGVALTTMKGGGGSGYDLAASLSRVDLAIQTPATQLTRASTLAQIQEVGTAAKAAVLVFGGELDELDQVRDADTRRVARSSLEADRTLLATWGDLADLSDEAPQAWAGVATRLDSSATAWEKAQTALSDADVAPTSADLRRTVQDATRRTVDFLTAGAAKLQTNKTETDRVTADKTSQLVALNAYAPAVRSQLRRYSTLRNDLAAFSARLGNVQMTFDEAYSFLRGAASNRQEVRNTLAGLTPPTALTGSHTGLLAVIDMGVSGTQSASEGLRQYQYDYYGSWKTTPAWLTFQEKSTQITQSYNAATSAWEKQVGDETTRINAIAVPAKPAT